MAFDIAGRFWAKVKKTEYCWLWTGAVSRSGRKMPRGFFAAILRAPYFVCDIAT